MRRILSGPAVMALAVASALAGPSVPLKQVVLFTSGVGYFERAASVNNVETAELSFTVSQINDVIKSMVLIDPSGGSVSAVTYDSQDPVEKTLKSFSVDLSDNPSMYALLNRLRGAALRIKTTGQDWEGRVLGAERKQVLQDGKTVETIDILNLSGADGVRSVPLGEIQKIEVLDPSISGDIQRALETLSTSLDRNKKGLRLTFSGKGRREVRVGYMIETPVWKTSYRLVIEDKSLFLQGWAHVENTTDEDWRDVKLSLVSGRPLSFVQDLYSPIYIQRPVVQPETYAAVAPPSYEGVFAEAFEAETPAPMVAMAPRERMARAPAAPARGMKALGVGAADLAGGGIQAAAEGREAGELFEYGIRDPVSIARQQSAMIPIVNDTIKGEPVSIYNQGVNDKNPLNGVELDNSSKVFLMHGPVTVFEKGIYAGDARLSDTRPGEKKLISYALDLACDVKVERDQKPEEIVSLKINRGTLLVERKLVSDTAFKLSSKRTAPRKAIVEAPVNSGWNLVEPKEAPEKTADLYRFRLDLPPGKTTTLNLREQRIVSQAMALTSLDVRQIELYLRQKVISAKMKDALKRLADMQGRLVDVRRQKEAFEKKRGDIVQDQERIRQNMRTVDRNSESYSRWERKLSQQEDQLDGILEEIEKLIADERAKQAEMEEYIAGLNAE